jgi:predicted homoserine dehydrogenase-like protein
MHVAAIAELNPQKAKDACRNVGWPEEATTYGDSPAAIHETFRNGRTVLTEDANHLIQADLDVICEMTGIPEAGVQHAWNALENGKHVVMVNVEADALSGWALRKKADVQGRIYSMAYGDQPALVLELIDWARTAGFEVVCAGKGTYYQPEYHYSTPETVWGYFGLPPNSLPSDQFNVKMHNSFLDGTKSAVEMCAVANGSGLTVQRCGLHFAPVGVKALAERLKPVSEGGILEHGGTVDVVASENRDGSPVDGDLRWGVFVVFKAPSEFVKTCFLMYGMNTDRSYGYASLYRPAHLIGLELGISLASVCIRGEPTGSTGSFVGDVASVAKKDLKPGDMLDGEGGYCVFGKLVSARESVKARYLPMGLTNRARVIRPVRKDEILTYDDVELDEHVFAVKLRKSMEEELRTDEG